MDARGAASSRCGGSRAFAAILVRLMPCIIGLAASRIASAAAGAGCYVSTDDGVFTDGATLVALGVIGFGSFLFLYEKRLSAHAARRLNAICIVGAACSLAALGALQMAHAGGVEARFALTVCVSAFSLVSAACWVRQADARITEQACALVFGAFALSEAVLYTFSFLPLGLRWAVGAVIAAAQLPLLARPMLQEGAIERAEAARPRFDDCYVYMKAGTANGKFFAACAVGIAAIALVVGFLRGFPFGEPIPFSVAARTACFLLTEGLYCSFALAVVCRRTRAMTVGIWVVMEILAAMALVLYCAFPDRLDVGAVAATALSSLMSAFVLYIISALMAVGKREPLSYALRLWFLWLASRAVGRFVLLALLPIGSRGAPVDSHLAGTHLAGTIISLVLLVSTQIILVKLMDVERFAAREQVAREIGCSGEPMRDAVKGARPNAFERWLGIESEAASLGDVRHAAMRRSAEEMGRQFLLSNREIEVLTLYALGHTQKHLADELCVSQATVRTHVKRIYAKCGLHSRQELLDYLARYTS